MGGDFRCRRPTNSTSKPAFCKVKHDLLTRWSVTKSLITDTITRFKMIEISSYKITDFLLLFDKISLFLKKF